MPLRLLHYLVAGMLFGVGIACGQSNFVNVGIQIQAPQESAIPFLSGTLAIIHAPGNVELVATALTDATNVPSITFVSSRNVLAVTTPQLSSPTPLPRPPYQFVSLYPWLNVPAGYYSLQAIASNSSGLLATSAVLNVSIRTNLIQNGGFETGDFRGWTLAGTPNNATGNYNSVVAPYSGTSAIHSGYWGAALGDIKVASLSQNVSTIPGQYYLLSLWLDNPVSGTNQLFKVNWDTNDAATNTLVSIVSPPAFSWTKLEFFVMAEATNVALQIQAENGPNYFGLDDISVTPVPPPVLQGSAISANSVQLSWLTAPGVTYQLKYKNDLLQMNWSNLQSAFVATSSSSSLLDTNLSGGSSPRFYRLILP